MSILAFVLAIQAAAQPMIDGIARPHATETTSRFACQNLVGRIGYHQEFLDPGHVPRLELALGARLSELGVAGRTIPQVERAKAEALFATLAWVINTDARCFDGRFQFNLTAMPKQGWLDFIEHRRPARPETQHHTIEVWRDGSVIVDGRGP